VIISPVVQQQKSHRAKPPEEMNLLVSCFAIIMAFLTCLLRQFAPDPTLLWRFTKAMEMGSSIHRAAELRSTHPIRPPPEPDSNRSLCWTTTQDTCESSIADCAPRPPPRPNLNCFVDHNVRWLIVTSPMIPHPSLCVVNELITSIDFPNELIPQTSAVNPSYRTQIQREYDSYSIHLLQTNPTHLLSSQMSVFQDSNSLNAAVVKNGVRTTALPTSSHCACVLFCSLFESRFQYVLRAHLPKMLDHTCCCY
jgi:hypothetical protein